MLLRFGLKKNGILKMCIIQSCSGRIKMWIWILAQQVAFNIYGQESMLSSYPSSKWSHWRSLKKVNIAMSHIKEGCHASLCFILCSPSPSMICEQEHGVLSPVPPGYPDAYSQGGSTEKRLVLLTNRREEKEDRLWAKRLTPSEKRETQRETCFAC